LNSLKITDAIAVGIFEAPWIDLIKNGGLPPGIAGNAGRVNHVAQTLLEASGEFKSADEVESGTKKTKEESAADALLAVSKWPTVRGDLPATQLAPLTKDDELTSL
jgi:hypothetical protein